MAQHRWNRRFLESADASPDNLLYFEPDRVRRRRNAERRARNVELAREVDRSGSARHLERAAKRLKHVHAADRVLYVPQWDMAKAEMAMRKAGVTGAVSNLCGTRRKVVKSGRR